MKAAASPSSVMLSDLLMRSVGAGDAGGRSVDAECVVTVVYRFTNQYIAVCLKRRCVSSCFKSK